MEGERKVGAYEKRAGVYDFAIDESCCGELGMRSEREECGAVLIGEKADGRGVVEAERIVAVKYMLNVFYRVCAKYLEVDDEVEEFRDLNEEK